MARAYLHTPIGFAAITGDEMGISSISLVDETEIDAHPPAFFAEAIGQLQEYFENKRDKFTFAINPIGTPFQQKVWVALRDIPFGTTTSYLALSQKLGDAKAIRAVAAANGKNPLWIVVPCHRVIGTDGSLTGYAGGLWRKKWLLEHENPTLQQSLF